MKQEQKATKQQVWAVNPKTGLRQSGILLKASNQVRFKSGFFAPYYAADKLQQLEYGPDILE